jgi:hypothetical protein
MGPVRKRKSKKKKRKSGTANKIKESRSLIGQAKYMLKNKFMPGNGHNQMMGELRSQSLMGDKDHDTFEFETGNYKPLELNTEEGAPKIKIDQEEQKHDIPQSAEQSEYGSEYCSEEPSDSDYTTDDAGEHKFEQQKSDLD